MCLNLTEHVGSIIITYYKGTASNIIISARKR